MHEKRGSITYYQFHLPLDLSQDLNRKGQWWLISRSSIAFLTELISFFGYFCFHWFLEILEQLQNTRPRLRDIEHLLPQSRGRVVISKGKKKIILWVSERKARKSIAPAVPHSCSGRKWILNGYRTRAPAVPHPRSGWKWILNGYRTSAPAVPLWLQGN